MARSFEKFRVLDREDRTIGFSISGEHRIVQATWNFGEWVSVNPVARNEAGIPVRIAWNSHYYPLTEKRGLTWLA